MTKFDDFISSVYTKNQSCGQIDRQRARSMIAYAALYNSVAR